MRRAESQWARTDLPGVVSLRRNSPSAGMRSVTFLPLLQTVILMPLESGGILNLRDWLRPLPPLCSCSPEEENPLWGYRGHWFVAARSLLLWKLLFWKICSIFYSSKLSREFTSVEIYFQRSCAINFCSLSRKGAFGEGECYLSWSVTWIQLIKVSVINWSSEVQHLSLSLWMEREVLQMRICAS